MRRTAAPALLVLALALGAAACGDDTVEAVDDPGPAASSTTSEPAPPPFQDGTLPQGELGALGVGLGLTDVRSESRPEFDRVVLELGGTGTPSWRVEYVPRPIAEGSGDVVPVEGEVFLQVVLAGVGQPVDTGLPAYGDDTTRVPGVGAVTEIAPGGVFEGYQQAFIGLTGAERPFRVFALTDPVRVVVDVQVS